MIDPAAGSVHLFVRRPRHLHRKFVAPIPREDGMGVPVDESRKDDLKPRGEEEGAGGRRRRKRRKRRILGMSAGRGAEGEKVDAGDLPGLDQR